MTKNNKFKMLIIFLLVFPLFPVDVTANADKYELVLRQTASDLGFDPAVNREGTEDEIFYSITAYNPDMMGLQFKVMVYKSKKIKQGVLEMGNAFMQTAKAQAGSLPSKSSSTRIFDGISVEQVSWAPHNYSGPVTAGATLKTTTLTVEPDPLIVFSVLVQGDRNPDPYMSALIKNLKNAGLFGPVDEGVAFTVQVRKDGWLPVDRPVATGNASPSSITLTGRVLDPAGQPVTGARLHIPSLNLSTDTNMDGSFRLYTATQGKDPFTLDFNITMQQPVSGTRVTITGPDFQTLPVPYNTQLTISATDRNGQPISKAAVGLNWTIPGFVRAPVASTMLDTLGQAKIPLEIHRPGPINSNVLAAEMLTVKVEAVVKPRDGGETARGIYTSPLNLALISGLTVGPDMQPREEAEAPRITGVSQKMCVDRWKDETGRFGILVHPLHPVSLKPMDNWELFWNENNHLPLNYPMATSPQPGQVLEVGKIDVLTPQEHIQRLTGVLKEFCSAMALTPTEQSGIQNAILRLVFQPGSSNDVPVYLDNYTDDSGIITTPGKAEAYWGNNLNVGDDPAYQIIPHELGHFVHHHLVEKHAFIHMCYNKLSTGDHETWKVPSTARFKAPYLSFSENTADFFALVFRNFWASRHPEIKESPYFMRPGYMPEFKTDEKAMAVVGSGTPGYLVEGVQTRFLRAFYGNAVNTRPAVVFNDYLNTMLLHLDRQSGWAGTLTNRPARTISQWVQTKQSLPRGLGSADVSALAGRYRLFEGAEPEPTATPEFGKKESRIIIYGHKEDFSAFPVVTIPFNQIIQVTAGLINIDLSDATVTRTLVVKAPARIKLYSRTRIKVYMGMVGADFPIEIETPGGIIKPTGTVVQVHVDDQEQTDVSTLHGSVQVTSNTGRITSLGAGQSIQMTADGAFSAVNAFNPEARLSAFLPDLELPPLPRQGSGSSPGLILNQIQERIKDFPWTNPDRVRERIKNLPRWALPAAALLAAILGAISLWLIRRLLIALVVGPVMTIIVAGIGWAIITGNALDITAFFRFLLSPLSAWQNAGQGLPAVAWLAGGLAGGMIVGRRIQSLVAGLLIPIIPWLLIQQPLKISDIGSGQEVQILKKAVMAAPKDLMVVLAATALGAFLGGLILPRRKKAKRSRRRSSRHHYDDNYDDDLDDPGGFDGDD